MPLIKSSSKKALQKNIKTEMDANPSPSKRSQNLAIAYSTQRQSKKKKMADGGMVDPGSINQGIGDSVQSGAGVGAQIKKGFLGKAKGGEIRAASSRPDADNAEDERNMNMERQARGERMYTPESNFHDEEMTLAGDLPRKREMDMTEANSEHHDPRKKFAFGGELSFNDEKHYTEDDYDDERSHNMLDSKSTRHGAERRAASGMVDEDSDDSMEMDMLHTHNQPDEYSKEGIINYAKGGSVADHIRRKMYAKGGMIDDQESTDPDHRDIMDEQSDVQDNNGDEHLNYEDEMSFRAARKKTYFDDSQISSQPEDSNEHGDELSDADSHDMVSSIRRKMKSKKMMR